MIPFEIDAGDGNYSPIFFNGRFFSQPITGVQRYAREILLAMDEGLQVERPLVLLVPPGCEVPSFRRIEVKQVGSGKGHIWEQLDLAFASRGGVLVSLCGSGPLLHPRHLVTIHDVTLYRMPKTFKVEYILLHRIIDFILSKTSTLSTVSKFSALEIADVLGYRKNIIVAGNSAQHMLRVTAEELAVSGRGLVPFRYFVLLGSVKANKNIEIIREALSLLGETAPTVVVIGRTDLGAFSSSDKPASDASQLIFTGNISDGEVVALLRNSAALLFPSLYEGFGIPALEAMQLGCPVLVSDIDVMREVCGHAARYFSPTNARALADLIVDVEQDTENSRGDWVAKGMARAAQFSWSDSAMKLLDAAVKL